MSIYIEVTNTTCQSAGVVQQSTVDETIKNIERPDDADDDVKLHAVPHLCAGAMRGLPGTIYRHNELTQFTGRGTVLSNSDDHVNHERSPPAKRAGYKRVA